MDRLVERLFAGRAPPHVWGLPPGADFPRAVAEGLLAAAAGEPPEALARVQVIVNSGRMRRRMAATFERHAPLLLPRIGIIDAGEPVSAKGPSPLRRRLELARLVRGLVEREPQLAPRAAAFDLAGSLARLMDEMHEEGVPPSSLERVDAGAHAEHWERSLRFLCIVGDLMDGMTDGLRGRVEAQCAAWEAAPPAHLVLVAGSTGSRGPTADLIAAAARLPAGGMVLPGFDFDQPEHVWQTLSDAGPEGEDHPQYRIARLLRRLGIDPRDVARWPGAEPPSPARNRLLSLALRPAPVTDQWRKEGRALADLGAATGDFTLVEAPSPRIEAVAIALRLRHAVEAGQRAALITPDRTLARRVASALGRWGIEPDDSAGRPLAQTAPGRLLRHVAALSGRALTAESLLVLLKHPLVHGGAGRGDHLRQTRELELRLRRDGPVFPTPASLRPLGCEPWTGWVCRCAFPAGTGDAEPLETHVRRTIVQAEALAAGSFAPGAGALWEGEAGRGARETVDELLREADASAPLDSREFEALLATQLAAEVREATGPHPDVMIWGTLEARTGAPDLAVLAGLTEGVWPEAPAPDPWLNRQLRGELGLLLPERRIGLAAHDFQQAVAAREVVLSRSIRDAEAETVPSRWLNRLLNLLGGLPERGGPAALASMRERGATWVDAARRHGPTAPPSPAPRPSPRPPVAQRPRQLAVTEVSKLVRDPYAIYARRILGLRRLDPLRAAPDAPLRGQVVHRVLERFVAGDFVPHRERAVARLMAVADEVLEAGVPWPVVRRVWRGRVARFAPWFVASEAERRDRGAPALIEERRDWHIGSVDFALTGRPDRVDLLHGGGAVVYDYKTGKAPSRRQVAHFDRQLLLLAAMVEAGVFDALGRPAVDEVAYVELGIAPRTASYALPFSDGDVAFDVLDTVAGLEQLIRSYDRPETGYTARRSVESTARSGDFDHLARFGEWADSDDAAPEDVG